MNGILENAIAGIIVACLSTVAGFLLLASRRYYHTVIENLILRLLETTLKNKKKDSILRQRIIDRVHREILLSEVYHNSSFIEYPNQEACESFIQEAFSSANKVVKILTIRGQKYFLSSRSLLYDK
jgi:hypothetical protein